MKRILFAALVSALIVVALGIAQANPDPRRVVVPAATTCHPRTPPSAGECVAQHFDFRRAIPTRRLAVAAAHRCVDISKYNGPAPNLSGVRCVIIQASYGLHAEPTLDSQITDAAVHGIPWGAYTFMEGYSGSQEAALAMRLTNGKGRTLGVWADAELVAAYPQACRYISQVRALHVPIYGLYAAPGMWPYSTGCPGKLWTAEWNVLAYPFALYANSALVLHQYCGRGCYLHGVETDLDEDRGLIAIAAAAHRKEAELRLDLARRATLAHLQGKHFCAHGLPSPPRYRPTCRTWHRQFLAVEAAIRRLRHEGVR